MKGKGKRGAYVHNKVEIYKQQLLKSADKDKTVKKNRNYILTKLGSKYTLYKGTYETRGESKEIDKELIEEIVELGAKDFEKFCVNYFAVCL